MTDIKENRCFYYTLYFNLKEEPLIIVLAYTIKTTWQSLGFFFTSPVVELVLLSQYNQ